MKSLLRLLAAQFLQKAISHPKTRQTLDWRFGLQLLLDRRVPFHLKFRAVGLGLAAWVALEVVQLPIQAALWVLLPLLGFAADTALDGMELLIVPFFVAICALPFLAPRDLVESLRVNGKSSIPPTDPQGRVYDASATIR